MCGDSPQYSGNAIAAFPFQWTWLAIFLHICMFILKIQQLQLKLNALYPFVYGALRALKK